MAWKSGLPYEWRREGLERKYPVSQNDFRIGRLTFQMKDCVIIEGEVVGVSLKYHLIVN
jgi:hypothetical protein